MFQVVSDAEDKADDEAEQNSQINRQCSTSSLQFSGAITQQFPEFFSPSNSTSMSSGDTHERGCSIHEEDSSPTFLDFI